MKTSILTILMLVTASFLKAEEPPVCLEELTSIFSNCQRQRRSVAADDIRLTFFANVTNLWWQGHKSNVLAIAEQRLACNSNDIAGLILKMEYDIEFLNFGTVSNSIQRVLNVGQAVQTAHYKAGFPFFKFNMQSLLELVAVYPEEEIEGDRAKSTLAGKNLMFEDDLFAVCLDGLVTNYPAQPPSGAAPQGGGGQQ